MEQIVIKTIRWVARITGALLLILISVFVFAEGFPNPVMLTNVELYLLIGMCTMIVGAIVAFKWELPGGLLLLGGYLFFIIVDGNLLPGPVFPIFPLVGLLYLIYWWRSRIHKKLSPSKHAVN